MQVLIRWQFKTAEGPPDAVGKLVARKEVTIQRHLQLSKVSSKMSVQIYPKDQFLNSMVSGKHRMLEQKHFRANLDLLNCSKKKTGDIRMVDESCIINTVCLQLQDALFELYTF